ncbi:tRNA threonylcarbamoyl adenosine modification protein YeaZ [Orientia chuto str. Dubai]|uniref:tRNA threonylcarbamoyl adenosine modification protein YeaZ n=1 Tax=Orientia chuto str. Dubai TaxID=1359168 RepID=A0A0F3MH36_9RICK|nr:tRNA (adenosine(37)-N6)-threonylcarbamoyltransferase complex dimerization subunit type 1 TsaB [Candidatus Orientia mediorientalis]KJV55058.1 tRNA threonylcarbamoyl adenosine modification protein YeaZ [Orientia chuto str. Dubai]
MKILGICTSNNRCSVAISENNNILAANYNVEPAMQAQHLVPMIQETIKQVKITFEDINYLAVTQGPGSFTGIRVGLAAALGITMASKIVPIVISDFEVLKFLIKQQIKGLNMAFAAIKAYRNKIYLQKFDFNSNTQFQAILTDTAEAVNLILNTKSLSACAGNATKMIYELLAATTTIPNNVFFLPRFVNYDAKPVCRLAYQLLVSKQSYSTELIPLYIHNQNFKHWKPN